MPSTYTTNIGIEKIETGQQAGTWGNTTNTNFDIIDQAINGIASVTLTSSNITSGGAKALPITDGAVSDGRNAFISVVDGGDIGGAGYVQLTPNDSEKILHIRNSLSASRSLFIFQGTYNASNDFELANGKDALVKFDGAGSGAVVSQVYSDLVAGNITSTVTGDVTGDLTGNVTGAVTGNVNGNLTGDVTGAVIGNVTGNVTSTGLSSFSSIDVNGGAIDGTPIGASSAAAGTFTNVTATGTVTVATADINGGAIDGANIGAATPGAGTFSALKANADHIIITTAQTPSSASAAGTQGEVAWDAYYLYVCIATNTWKRVALASW